MTGTDTCDSDSLDDAYDADNGGTIVVVRFDGADQPDYLDTDGDNDGIADHRRQ
ncbi:MAG: hypothetical protein H6994_09860 [Pseudomonadales bacterium]|nr:hypothetical protein [Pseudomonadales bacterium]